MRTDYTAWRIQRHSRVKVLCANGKFPATVLRVLPDGGGYRVRIDGADQDMVVPLSLLTRMKEA